MKPRLLALLVLLVPSALVAQPSWQIQPTPSAERLRGVSAVSDTVAWASGNRGTVLRTTDGGATWQLLTVPDADKLDFRDIEALDASTAWVLSIGSGDASRIYKTSDGGRTWTLQWTNPEPKGFYDALAFWDAQRGLAIGDPVDGHATIVRTADGGRTWTRVPASAIPAAIEGDGSFAASGTILVAWGARHAWFGTGGGARARVFRTSDGGGSWAVADTPVMAGNPSSGVFSLAFADARAGIAVGGDYRKEQGSGDNIALCRDGGASWALPGSTRLRSFRSAVAYVPGSGGRELIAAGPGGTDRSVDGGATWSALGDVGFHALSIERGGRAAWAVGEKGRVGRLVLKPTAATVTLPAAGQAPMPAGRRTLRLDYYHSGNVSTELFSVDRVVIEPAPWPGNPAHPIDDTNLGKYYFEVRERATNQAIYSRGFDSIYGEWETTAEARTAARTFHESLRFPMPAGPVQVVVKKRDAQNAFREVWATIVDPKDIYLVRSAPPPPGPVIEIRKSGEPSAKVDLLFLGEGYTAEQRGKCEADIRRLAEGVFTFPPFTERRADFNVWAICAAAPESGVSRPSKGQVRRTLFGSAFDAFGTERYALSFDNRAMRDIASFAPYDALGIVMNENAYGNGGIFGQFASVSIDYPTAIPVFIHEFGHHFAALGDEYYFNAGVAYAPRTNIVEPWEPNITALLDPANVKWKALVAPGTPLPTPWPKGEYERNISETPKKLREMREAGKPAEEIAAARKASAEVTERTLNEGPYAGKVGAFEGALYEEKGYYRPEQRCIMISGQSFCAVCRAAITRIIDLHSK